MIRRIKYFQAVIRNNSFSEAAEQCHISQSAISQQIQSLEKELGFQLLERRNRKFTLTPAGEYFYKKSLVLIADFDRICTEMARIANTGRACLRIGYLREYSGNEFMDALNDFSSEFPDVDVKVEQGNHEELFNLLRTGKADMVFNDQRRAFSNEYVNLILAEKQSCIEISSRSPIAELKQVALQDLKNTPCILVVSKAEQHTEEEYYRNVIGFQGEFLFAENSEAARLLVIGGNGFMICPGVQALPDNLVRQIPLFRDDTPVMQKYCAFRRKDKDCRYAERFIDILKRRFESF